MLNHHPCQLTCTVKVLGILLLLHVMVVVVTGRITTSNIAVLCVHLGWFVTLQNYARVVREAPLLLAACRLHLLGDRLPSLFEVNLLRTIRNRILLADSLSLRRVLPETERHVLADTRAYLARRLLATSALDRCADIGHLIRVLHTWPCPRSIENVLLVADM